MQLKKVFAIFTNYYSPMVQGRKMTNYGPTKFWNETHH